MFLFDNKKYKSSEHLYQSLKSTSKEYRNNIRSLKEAEQAKTFSKKLLKENNTLLDDSEIFLLREDWEDVKLEAMRLSIELKFSQNKTLLNQLLQTKNEHLEERNDWGDFFWGTVDGVGENNLGIILMETRNYYLNLIK